MRHSVAQLVGASSRSANIVVINGVVQMDIAVHPLGLMPLVTFSVILLASAREYLITCRDLAEAKAR